MKKSLLASAIVMALSVSAAYAGDIITIDPDNGGVDAPQQVGGLGWNNGNAISTGVPLSQDDIGIKTIQTYLHAGLANFIDAGGNPIGGLNLNAGGANGYEWTYSAGFQELVVGVSAPAPFNTADFVTTAGGNNFFNIYYDPARNANNLTGMGFNDGLLILSGTILPFNPVTGEGTSSFTTTAINGALDQALGADNYPLIDSVAGNGSSNLSVLVDFANRDFFTSLIDGHSVLQLNFDTFQNLPYQTQNPSACFWDGSGLVDFNGAGGQGTACVNSVGAVNGIDGPNIMFETRASNDFNVVPEPASLALLGIGLVGLGFARRRKNQA